MIWVSADLSFLGINSLVLLVFCFSPNDVDKDHVGSLGPLGEAGSQSSIFPAPSAKFFSHHPSSIPHNTMASALRLGSSALRSSLATPAFTAKTAAFNGLRCYSSSKTQVRSCPFNRRRSKTYLLTNFRLWRSASPSNSQKRLSRSRSSESKHCCHK